VCRRAMGEASSRGGGIEPNGDRTGSEETSLRREGGPVLEIATERRADALVLRVRGELDLACAALLERRLERVLADGDELIVLEMSEVTFMDSTGLRTLLVGAERCRAAGSELLLGEVSRQVQRLLEISGAGGELERVAAEAEE
jgi:anti-sigma B factor antagonist